jgi:predicted negative regulator of RcsB-dependent stress response
MEYRDQDVIIKDLREQNKYLITNVVLIVMIFIAYTSVSSSVVEKMKAENQKLAFAIYVARR